MLQIRVSSPPRGPVVKHSPAYHCQVTSLVSGWWDWTLHSDSLAPECMLFTTKSNLFQKSGKTVWGHNVDIFKHVLKIWAFFCTCWIFQSFEQVGDMVVCLGRKTKLLAVAFHFANMVENRMAGCREESQNRWSSQRRASTSSGLPICRRGRETLQSRSHMPYKASLSFRRKVPCLSLQRSATACTGPHAAAAGQSCPRSPWSRSGFTQQPLEQTAWSLTQIRPSFLTEPGRFSGPFPTETAVHFGGGCTPHPQIPKGES